MRSTAPPVPGLTSDLMVLWNRLGPVLQVRSFSCSAGTGPTAHTDTPEQVRRAGPIVPARPSQVRACFMFPSCCLQGPAEKNPHVLRGRGLTLNT